MYAHILLPTDGSELSKMAIREGVDLAKALGARVTVVTVTTPFHVFSGSLSMLTDTPDQYKKHMGGQRSIWTWRRRLRRRPAFRVTVSMLSMNSLIKQLSRPGRIEDAMQSSWPRMVDTGCQPSCSVAKLLKC